MTRAAAAMVLALLLLELCWVTGADPCSMPAGAFTEGQAGAFSGASPGLRDPPPSGEWLVNGSESYEGINIQLNGNLTVAPGGSLSLSGVKLSIVSDFEGELHIEVQSGGELLVADRDDNPASPDDATVISSGSSFSYQFWVRSGAKLVFKNSVLRNCGYALGARGESSGLYLQSGDCELSNSTFRESYCGLAVDGSAPKLDNCTFMENRMCGLYIRDADLRIAGNLFDQNGASSILTSGGIQMTGSTAMLAGNLFRGNFHNGLFAQGCNLTLERNIFQLNKFSALYLDHSPAVSVGDEFYQNGLGYYVRTASLEVEGALLQDNPTSFHCEDVRVVMRNVTMINSTNWDIYLGRNTDHSEVLSYNCTFKKAYYNDQLSWLEVRWAVDFRVVWDSTGAPVQGAAVWVFDNKQNKLFDFTTNDTGALPPLVLSQYKESNAGRTELSPYRLGIFKGRFFNSTWVAVDQDIKRDLVLDDVPPYFTLTSPRENMTTSRAWVNFTGKMTSDFMAKLTVNGTEVSVDRRTGNFSAKVNLTEGKNVINGTAVDDFYNSFTVIRTVYRDSTPPMLTVDVPEEGLLLNRTHFRLTGRTDPGSYLKVNGIVPGLEADGNFRMELELVEGPNPVTVYSADQYQNGVWANRTITMDTVPPALEIISPPLSPIPPPSPPSLAGELWTNRPALRVQGRAEQGASIFLGGLPLELSGTNFSASVNLTDDDSMLIFQAVDAAGNWNTTAVLVHLDTVPPLANITYPPAGLPVNMTPINITGITEAQARVSSRDGTVTQDGPDFWVLCNLFPGPNLIAIDLRDLAGNVRRIVVNITFDGEATLRLSGPENYTSTAEPSIRVSGLAEPGSLVTVNDRNVNVAADGSFAAKVSLQNGPNIIVINVTDSAGNSASHEIVVFRTETPPVDYGWLALLAAGALAVIGIGAGAYLLGRQRAPRAPRPAVRGPAPLPWEQPFERPMIKAPEEPEEVLRCAQCLQPIQEDWISCHTCEGPTDLVSVSSQTFTRLAGTEFQTNRERGLMAALLKARSDILLLLDSGEPVPGRLREATVAAQLLLRGARPDLVEKKAAELAADLGPRAERLGAARARELEKTEGDARRRLNSMLDEVERPLGALRSAGMDVRDAERAAGLARVHMRGNNLEKAYSYALEAKKALDETGSGGGVSGSLSMSQNR